MSKLLSRIGLVSSLTLVSRILGLGRDMLTVAIFGASVWNSAFITAFTLPNLFRRLLGEGALTAALMPNLSEELEENGRQAVHTLVNKTLSWLLVICGGIILAAWAILFLVQNVSVSEKWILKSQLGIILFPYIALICMAAILSAVLNLFGRFGVPALTAVWLNLSIILFLGGIGSWLGGSPFEKMMFLCAGVMIGGFFQLIVPVWALRKEGWQPHLDFAVSDRLRNVMLLTLPGIYGAAAHQINILISRELAFYINDAGASLLYYSNRLVELPLGMFTIAISTVIFPALTKAVAGGRDSEFLFNYKKGVCLSTMMACPAAIGLGLLASEIIQTLFEHGLFKSNDTKSMVPILYIFAIGLPFYSFISIETRAFYAIKDIKSPVKAATLALLVNLLLSLALMRFFQTIGLAIASNASVVFQCFVLHFMLRKKRSDIRLRELGPDLLKIAAASIIMGIAVFGCRLVLALFIPQGHFGSLVALVFLIPLGSATYFLVLKAMRMESASEAISLLLRRKTNAS